MRLQLLTAPPLAYSGRVLGLAIAVGCLAAAIPHLADVGQPPSEAAYIALIEQYQRGDDDAIVALALLDSKTVDLVARALLKLSQDPASGPRGARLLRAAVAAHTDAAVTQRTGQQAIRWDPHLDAAERYVEELARRNPDDPVAASWWRISIGAMHAQRQYDQAMKIVRQAERVVGERPELLLAGGMTNELAWVWAHEQGFHSAFSGSLDEAEKAYRRVLAEQPAAVEPRLRLARVLTLRGDNESAVRTLADVPDTVAAPVWYLARLFEGDALERLGRDADARQRYEAAAKAVPLGQAAQLALAYSQYQGGARDDAAGRIRDSVSDSRPPEDADPAFRYSLGLGWAARAQLEALRAMVRRP